MDHVERSLIIQSNESGYDIALLENDNLVEFHKEIKDQSIHIGDVYWARVKKILPALNAVFIDIGESKEAFLHYSDLGEAFYTYLAFFRKLKHNPHTKLEQFEFHPPLEKNLIISDVLDKNIWLPVQVLKEPISSKGARLSTEISFAGRYCVLIPFDNKISVSKKIDDPTERKRLIDLCESIKPNNFGLIIRTVAQGVMLQEIHQDMLELYSKWEELCRVAFKSVKTTKLFEEEDRSYTLIRDILNDSFTNITVNDDKMAQSIIRHISKIYPGKEKIVKSLNNTKHLFEELGLTSKIKSSFNRTVLLPSGGYLVIEATEAMHVIDVNSGVNTFKKLNAVGEEAILKLNIEAAIEIARQIRLRDLGGIIVIDFVDSKNIETRQKILETMQSAMQHDKANYTILPLSKFCIMQITRSRVRPQVQVNNLEVCPSCNGTGKIQTSIVIADQVLSKLQSLIHYSKPSRLEVHPFLYAYLKRGFFSKWVKFLWKNKKFIDIKENYELEITQSLIYDKYNEIIET